MSADLKISRVRIEDLTADPDNARLHDRRNLDAIKASLERFGQTRPLVVTDDLLVIAGNGTLAAAMELGWDEVEVTIVPFRNADEARAFALADNRTGELAQWNVPVLLQALESLALEGWRLEEIGFAPEDLSRWKKVEPAPEDFPEFSDEDIETAYLCPQCGYEWSGRPE
ncbi:MAG: ParB/Srx family N-terminal domain-containing protein [Ignavibacteriales bacterium]